MTRSLLEILRGHPVMGAFLSLAVKVSGSLTALVMFALAARSMDVTHFGLLVIAFNAVSFVAVLAVLGQDTLILRTWGEFIQRSPALARGAVTFGFRVAITGAVLAVVGFVVWARAFDGRLETGDLVAVAAFLFTQTLLHYGSSLTRAVRGVFHSEPNRELTWRAPVVASLVWAIFADHTTSIASFFAVAAAGQVAALLFQSIAVRNGLPAAFRAATPEYAPRDWTRLSATMTTAAMAEAANQYADVVLIGALAGPVASAGYFVAARIASVFPMLTSGLHNYSASRIAELFFAGRSEELQRLLARVMALALVLVAALVGLILFAGPWLLSLFGENYRGEYGILLVLTAVFALTTLTGPGGMMMLTMGRERLYLRFVLAALTVRVAALVLLVPTLGILGAAVAVALAVVPFVVAVTWICVHDIGVDPSILSIPRHLRLPTGDR